MEEKNKVKQGGVGDDVWGEVVRTDFLNVVSAGLVENIFELT